MDKSTIMFLSVIAFVGILTAIALPIAHQKDIEESNALKYNCHNTEFFIRNFERCNNVGIYNITQTSNGLNK